MTIAGQPTVNYQYDANSQLVNLSTTINSQLSTFNFTYDSLGRRTSLSLPNGVTTNYTYDNASRLLTLESLNPINQILESLSYTYDSTGNRISMDRLNVSVKLPAPATNITYNSANQMLTFKDKNIAYDNNGNMATITNSCGTTNYTWDARNRLTGISGFNSDCSVLSASFKYDAMGRRVEKTINGKTTNYLYDGMDIVQEIENGTVTVNYIRTLNIKEPLALINQEGAYYYTLDGLGSVIGLTDQSGNKIVQYTYDPYGNTTTSNPAFKNPFQYTGQENDYTGLYNYGARYYSPELQRFISEDPIGFDSGDVNYYSYIWNDPINWIDPLGLIGLVKSPYYSKSSCPISPIYTYAREQRAWGHQQYPGELNSSMRHCVVSCTVASKFSSGDARIAGFGNEIQGFILHDIFDLRGRLSGKRPWAFQLQDLRDNERGIKCSEKNKCNGSKNDVQENCIQCCSKGQ